MVRALERVALVNGINRSRPGFLQSWQHSTIAKRVAFLDGVIVDREAEERFQRRLWRTKWALMLALGGFALVGFFCGVVAILAGVIIGLRVRESAAFLTELALRQGTTAPE